MYWSNIGGQRDIFTVAPAGGDAGRDDERRAPSTGRRSGRPTDASSTSRATAARAMNLWRIAVDQSSGRAAGAPGAGHGRRPGRRPALPRFSKDGSRLGFRSRVASVNPVAIPFDPATLRAGAPFVLDTRNNIRVPSDVSPDGKQIAYFSIGEHQEDMFIGTPDGPMRRVTDDAARDRAPMFMPDGRSLVFYSNRDGTGQPWIDRRRRRRSPQDLTAPTSGAVYVSSRPKATRSSSSRDSGRGVFSAPLASAGAAPRNCRGTTSTASTSARPHGRQTAAQLAGSFAAASGRPAGVGDLRSRRAEDDDDLRRRDLCREMAGRQSARRLLHEERLGARRPRHGDAQTRPVVDVRLPGPSTNDMFAISPDSRTIYYGAVRAEADIWIVERK